MHQQVILVARVHSQIQSTQIVPDRVTRSFKNCIGQLLFRIPLKLDFKIVNYHA